MPANRTPGPVDISADPRWGYNPLTRRYIKRSGEIWRRLVKAGVVQDEEVASQLANGAGTKTKYIRGQNVVVQADRDAASRTVADVFDPAKLSNATAANRRSYLGITISAEKCAACSATRSIVNK